MDSNQLPYHFQPIGHLQTCFKEKFGIPRQSLLVKEAKGVLKLRPDPFFKDALREIEGFSHLWVLFVFHHQEQGTDNGRPLIRPPRLGGVQRVGALASRSPHRPNPIGLSAVELERVDYEAEGGVELHLAGVDMLDGTPVLDVRPYIPYADSIPDAQAGWAAGEIEKWPVSFTEKALREIAQQSLKYPQLKKLIIGLLELDPRPAFQQSKRVHQERDYGMRILEFDVKWNLCGEGFEVKELLKRNQSLPLSRVTTFSTF